MHILTYVHVWSVSLSHVIHTCVHVSLRDVHSERHTNKCIYDKPQRDRHDTQSMYDMCHVCLSQTWHASYVWHDSHDTPRMYDMVCRETDHTYLLCSRHVWSYLLWLWGSERHTTLTLRSCLLWLWGMCCHAYYDSEVRETYGHAYYDSEAQRDIRLWLWGSFICVTWLWLWGHAYYDSEACVVCLYVSLSLRVIVGMTRPHMPTLRLRVTYEQTYVWQVSERHAHTCVWHGWERQTTHAHIYVWACLSEACHTCLAISDYVKKNIHTIGWRRLVGSIKSIFFCKRALYKRWCSASETYHLKEPTNRIQLYRQRDILHKRPITYSLWCRI